MSAPAPPVNMEVHEFACRASQALGRDVSNRWMLSWFVRNGHAVRLSDDRGYLPEGVARLNKWLSFQEVAINWGGQQSSRYTQLLVTPVGEVVFLNKLIAEAKSRGELNTSFVPGPQQQS